MKIEFKDLEILVKFLHNRVNYEMFEEMMTEKYRSESYIESLWVNFKKDPLTFMVSRDEKELFRVVQEKIEKMGYKG